MTGDAGRLASVAMIINVDHAVSSIFLSCETNLVFTDLGNGSFHSFEEKSGKVRIFYPTLNFECSTDCQVVKSPKKALNEPKKGPKKAKNGSHFKSRLLWTNQDFS